MCGAPKPPPLPPPDPEVERQKQLARERNIDEMEREKAATTRDSIARSSGMVGTRSLITGSRGGSGYGRSLIG